MADGPVATPQATVMASSASMALTLPTRSESSPEATTPTRRPKKVACCVHFCEWARPQTRSHSWTMVRRQKERSWVNEVHGRRETVSN